ncbi:MAG: hypothetical protein A2Y79_07920 [Deltaproteobacteria bacterium RBG_13_43_22]|nr:MAG: hypothetical protein A2Y79_07920 [Deltaproteobacteria bacterium RBG_13_43_22]
MKEKSFYEERPWLKNYSSGVPAEIAIPLKSVGEAFDEATDKWKKKTAIVFYGRRITFRELREKVDRLATALFHQGIRKGDRVAILLLNCPEFVFAFYGLIKLGAIAVPLSPIHNAVELKQHLQDSGAKAIICQDILYEEIEKTGSRFEIVILTNITESLQITKKSANETVLREIYQNREIPSVSIFKQKGFYRLHDLFTEYSPDPPRIEIKPKEDLVSFCYTGGTTGMAKGATITHYSFVACIIQFHPWFPFEDGKDVMVVYAPMYHIGGQTVVMGHGLISGGTIVLLSNPKIDDILDAITRYKVTFFTGLPTMYETLRNYKKTSKVDWKKIKFCTSALDAIHETTNNGWQSLTGHPLHQIYGMTEAPGVIISPFGRAKNGSIGVPVTNVVAAIVDPEQNEFIPVGKIGELAVYGPQVTLGYWNNPEATNHSKSLINGKWWFRTGDLGKMDKDGYFYLMGRKQDLIKYKGLRIHSSQVEEVLLRHPHIKEAGVIGVPDIKVGELVKAFIVLEKKFRGKFSKEEIIEYCQSELAHYKVPKIIEFVDEIPKTRLGKISRRALKEI